jgi:hypothetical protein
MLTIDSVYQAQNVLKEVARKTDVIYAPKLCPNTPIYLKTEKGKAADDKNGCSYNRGGSSRVFYCKKPGKI